MTWDFWDVFFRELECADAFAWLRPSSLMRRFHISVHKPQSLLLGGFVDRELQQRCVLRWQLARGRVAFAAQCCCGCWQVCCACPGVFQRGCSVSDVTKDVCDSASLTESSSWHLLVPGTRDSVTRCCWSCWHCVPHCFSSAWDRCQSCWWLLLMPPSLPFLLILLLWEFCIITALTLCSRSSEVCSAEGGNTES